MMYSDSDEDLDVNNRKAVFEGRAILERTGQSLARSEQVAIETENIGATVVSELGEQRETLLRAKTRLTNADDQLNETRNLLKKMGRNVLYNKLILVLIIILEILILACVSYLKFKK